MAQSRYEILLTSPRATQSSNYILTAQVRGEGAGELAPGGSLRIHCQASGLAEEIFLDHQAAMTLDIQLLPETDNGFELTLVDPAGHDLQSMPISIRHASQLANELPPAAERSAGVANLGQRPLDPPWPTFALLVKDCLYHAANLADATGRERSELFEQVYAQERYAEQACADHNQVLYQECCDNLRNFAVYLQKLQPYH